MISKEGTPAMFLIRACIIVTVWGFGARVLAAPTELTGCATIGSSGSYVLTTSLSATTSPCFAINADYVTLDLGGHDVLSAGSAIGVSDGGVTRRGVVVRNGTLTSFVTAVALANSTMVTVRGVQMDGVATSTTNVVAGDVASVFGCRFTDSGTHAIALGDGSIIESNETDDLTIHRLIEGATDGMLISRNRLSRDDFSPSGEDGIVTGGGGVAVVAFDNVVIGAPDINMYVGPAGVEIWNAVKARGMNPTGTETGEGAVVAHNFFDRVQSGVEAKKGVLVVDNYISIDPATLSGWRNVQCDDGGYILRNMVQTVVGDGVRVPGFIFPGGGNRISENEFFAYVPGALAADCEIAGGGGIWSNTAHDFSSPWSGCADLGNNSP